MINAPIVDADYAGQIGPNGSLRDETVYNLTPYGFHVDGPFGRLNHVQVENGSFSCGKTTVLDVAKV